jgi:hypothetical protein
MRRHNWEDNIKTDVKNSVQLYVLDLSGSVQRPVAFSCEHSNEPYGSITYGEFLEKRSISFSIALCVIQTYISVFSNRAGSEEIDVIYPV